ILLVVRNPFPLAQAGFAASGNHRDRTCRCTGAATAHRQRDLLVDRVLEQRKDVYRGIQRMSVDGENIVALADVYAGGRKRRYQERIPTVAAVDLCDLVEPFVDIEVGPEQADTRGPLLVDIAPAGAVVTDLELADHLDQQLVQVLAPLHELEQGLVAGAHRGPVE